MPGTGVGPHVSALHVSAPWLQMPWYGLRLWRGQQGSGGSGQGCWPCWEREQDLAAWLCCHGVSREMALPRIIRADGLVLRSEPLAWGKEGGIRVPVGSGHCQAQAWPQ